MRLELSGSISSIAPVFHIFSADDPTWSPAAYIAAGYEYYDVICIGGGGGRGGGITDIGSGVRSYGGAGGGGGLHRVKGRLDLLPIPCPVWIGLGGDPGIDDASNPANTTDGEDGGYSSFGGTICQASAGKGGKRVDSISTTVTNNADGGDGGIGDSIIAGGGGTGGVAGDPPNGGPGVYGTDGEDGTWDEEIGQGGGGGAGGVYVGGGTPNLVLATKGGTGSYNASNSYVYSPGGEPTFDPALAGSYKTIPGIAGGGKVTPLDGLVTEYGKSAQLGIVVVRFT